MSRTAAVFCLLLALGCPGFRVGGDDAGPSDDGAASDAGDRVDAVAPDASDAPDGGPFDLDAGPCTAGEFCEDGNACTEGERCDELGCGGGSPITCAGTTTRCEDDAYIESTLTGSCDETTGCVANDVVTQCTFSCAPSGCTLCRPTDWRQSLLPFAPGRSEAFDFAVDAAGGQHLLVERVTRSFQAAVDYAYRAGDGAPWQVTNIKEPGDYLPGLVIALDGEAPHFLIIVDTEIEYWRPAADAWVPEPLPGAYEENVAFVVRPGGEAHVIRSIVGGLMHARRNSAGEWTEARIAYEHRPREVSACLLGDEIYLAFRDDDEGLGVGRYDGSAWTFQIEDLGQRLFAPDIAVAPDGTVVSSYAIGDGDIGVTTISPSGVPSSVVLTASIPRVTDERSMAVDDQGGTHVVFQEIGGTRAARSAYRAPGGNAFTFREIVRGTESRFRLNVDALGKLRMVSVHFIDPSGHELRFSSRQLLCL